MLGARRNVSVRSEVLARRRGSLCTVTNPLCSSSPTDNNGYFQNKSHIFSRFWHNANQLRWKWCYTVTQQQWPLSNMSERKPNHVPFQHNITATQQLDPPTRAFFWIHLVYCGIKWINKQKAQSRDYGHGWIQCRWWSHWLSPHNDIEIFCLGDWWPGLSCLPPQDTYFI